MRKILDYMVSLASAILIFWFLDLFLVGDAEVLVWMLAGFHRGQALWWTIPVPLAQ
jgi:hypothetical protein